MIPLTVEEIAALAPGRLEGEGQVTGMQIDSRRIVGGDLFVAVGDGSAFLAAARAAGAAATLVPDDPHAALAAIAGAVRARSSARVVGVTGSTGKTSTKDILGALCAPHARTIATERSFNAELGVPLTLCRLEPDTEVCIVELGMRGFGQIAELCAFARPEIGIVTSIGPVHLELVGSVEGVARSKGELLEALPVGGVAIVPADASALDAHLRSDLAVRRFGEPEELMVGEHDLSFAFRGRRVRFPFTARHQARNALAALEAYAALDLPLDDVQKGADAVTFSAWRGEELPLAGGGIVINDAYNANPTSMRAALEHLVERARGRRSVAVLGGMAELGVDGPSFHRELGLLARELGVAELVAVGELARDYEAETWVEDAAGALELLRGLVRPGDAVLVKASRAVGLEGIAPALANESD